MHRLIFLELPYGHMVLQFPLMVLVRIWKQDSLIATDLFFLCRSMHENLKQVFNSKGNIKYIRLDSRLSWRST